uniref:Uncharacterized protein n=1 Tax=Salix viminalis TaxID=40686 RepID=A0A6N2NGA1_SALVM
MPESSYITCRICFDVDLSPNNIAVAMISEVNIFVVKGVSVSRFGRHTWFFQNFLVHFLGVRCLPLLVAREEKLSGETELLVKDDIVLVIPSLFYSIDLFSVYVGGHQLFVGSLLLHWLSGGCLWCKEIEGGSDKCNLLVLMKIKLIKRVLIVSISALLPLITSAVAVLVKEQCVLGSTSGVSLALASPGFQERSKRHMIQLS